MENVHSVQEFEAILAGNEAVLAYFSTQTCSVCKVLKPKVAEMLAETFSEIKMIFVESDRFPELAAQNRIFTAPTVLVFFDGRETIRKSRAFGIDELRSEIQRPYSILFE